MKISNFAFEALESFNEGFNNKEFAKAEQTRTSPPLETSTGPAEPPIDLKLGKRTYFEINCVGSSAKASTFSVDPLFSTATTKKIKPSSQSTLPPRCQVEGCNLDLSRAKEYHRKHKVCESHSKCPKVIVNGQERRFCQQCSRFHSLSEFDEKKRSCRRRLSDHNARRRKPQLEAIQFNSTKLSSSFYGGEQKLSFELSNGPLVHTRPPANSTWENTFGLKFTPTKGCVLKPLKSGGVEDQPHLQDFGLPHAISMLNSVSNIHLPCKDTAAEVFNQDSKESIFSSNLGAAPDLHLAHSLLSTNSWGSQAESITFSHPIMHVDHTKMPQAAVREVPQAPPNVSSDYWQTEEQSFDSHSHTLTANSNGGHHFQESKLFREAYLTGFYSNHMN